MLYILLAIAIIGVDRLTKWLVVCNISLGQSKNIMGDILLFTYSRNKGAAFGIFQDARAFFIVIAFILIGILLYLFKKYNNKFARVAIAMIIAGAVGNLIDRAFDPLGVVDFINIPWLTLIFPNFNIADMSVVFGSVFLAVYFLFICKDDVNKDNENEAQIDS